MFETGMNFGLGEDVDALRDMVSKFARDRIAPVAADTDRDNAFPMHLWKEMGDLGLLGMTADPDYGGTGMGYVAHCVAMEEISRASASVGLSYGAHSNLCVNQINRWGSDAQKEKYLPKLCSGEHVGALAMSEPNAGSDVVSMKLRAEKKNDRYVLNGAKMWITNSPVADVAVVWAKAKETRDDPGVIRGFLVEKGMEGFSAPKTHNKMSLRASITGEIVLEDCFVPDANILPEVEGLKGPLSCLTQARYGISWGVLGAALCCFETALNYATDRIQFDRPIAGFQLTQKKLVDMGARIVTGHLLSHHLAKLKDAGELSPIQVSLAKRENVRTALDIARESRSILGANGIMEEYPILRHSMNLESVYTYEGTHEVHTLAIGRALTGISAFS